MEEAIIKFEYIEIQKQIFHQYTRPSLIKKYRY